MSGNWGQWPPKYFGGLKKIWQKNCFKFVIEFIWKVFLFASQIILSSPAQTMCLARSHLAWPFLFCHYHHFHLEIIFYPRCKHVITQGNSNRVVFLFFRTKDQIPSVLLMQAVGGGSFVLQICEQEIVPAPQKMSSVKSRVWGKITDKTHYNKSGQTNQC